MNMDNYDVLTLIVPCFNEEEVLPTSSKKLNEVLSNLISEQDISPKSKILFVDDGSDDDTWNIIRKLSNENEHFSGIKFSRNFGHQNALLAGMTTAVNYSDILVTIDADLQDDTNAIYEMVNRYHQGFDVAYGVRSSRKTDSLFKRKSALIFYDLMKKLGVEMVPNSADYRLMSKRATRELLSFSERNLFLRAMVPLVGYRSTKVFYERKKRFAGKSKYPLSKMVKFALDGITSFSIVPIRLIMSLGILIVFIGIILFVYTVVQKIRGNVNSGWASLMISIWVLGGVQLVCLSVIGEYIGKVFTEVKRRPRFNIETDLFTEQSEDNDDKS